MRCALLILAVLGSRPALAEPTPSAAVGAEVAPEGTIHVCAEAQVDAPGLLPVVGGHQGWLFHANLVGFEYWLAHHDLGLLRRFNDTLAERGTTLVLLRNPPREVVYGQYVDTSDPAARGFSVAEARAGYVGEIEALRKAGLLVADVLGAYDEAVAANEKVYYQRDHHWTRRGSDLAAQAVARVIRAQPGSADLPETHLRRREFVEVPGEGTLGQRVEHACGPFEAPPEMFPEQPVEVAAAPVSAADLFGARPAPEVVVVGDSYVNYRREDRMDFRGALGEALNADVLVVGLTGGGGWRSMLEFLDSPEQRAHPPRFLVWQSSVTTVLYEETWLRQVIPAVRGPCEAPLVQDDVTVATGESSLLELPADVTVGDAYLFFEADDPNLLDFELRVQYADGHVSRTKIERWSLFVQNSRRYYLLLDRREAPLQGVSISVDTPPEGQIHASLCEM